MQLKMINHPCIWDDSRKTVSHPVSCLKLVWAGTNNIKTAQNVAVYAKSVFSEVEQCCQYITPMVLLARLILRFSEHLWQLPVHVTAKKKTDYSSSCMLISSEHKLCSKQHTLTEDEESFSYPSSLLQTEVLLLLCS